MIELLQLLLYVAQNVLFPAFLGLLLQKGEIKSRELDSGPVHLSEVGKLLGLGGLAILCLELFEGLILEGIPLHPL